MTKLKTLTLANKLSPIELLTAHHNSDPVPIQTISGVQYTFFIEVPPQEEQDGSWKATGNVGKADDLGKDATLYIKFTRGGDTYSQLVIEE